MEQEYTFTNQEIEDGKAMAGIAYLGIIGFLIAFLTSKDNRFVLYHAQQALVVAIGFFLSPIPFLGWLIGLFCIILMVIGLINVFSGKVQPLPVVGNIGFSFKLLKEKTPPTPPGA